MRPRSRAGARQREPRCRARGGAARLLRRARPHRRAALGRPSRAPTRRGRKARLRRRARPTRERRAVRGGDAQRGARRGPPALRCLPAEPVRAGRDPSGRRAADSGRGGRITALRACVGGDKGLLNALECGVVALRSGEDPDTEVSAEPGLMKALEMIAPGTALREGIDSILHARTGGLIVIGEPEDLAFLNSGGIKLELDYTPAFLYQVAKMDGAIILNANATKITMANVQLMPDPTILSHETGTRHRTAERVSKQTDALVIAISQRREVVAVYVDGTKYILEDIPVVLAKANQALATLDKYRTRLDQVSTRLTALEFEGGVTLHDVLTVLQRSELVTRMAVEIERYIVELGTEGRLIEMQLEETTVGTAAEKAALVRDYLFSYSDEAFAAGLEEIGRLAHQDLLDFGRLAELLGFDRKLNTLDYPVSPRGYRVLGRIPRLPKLVVTQIVNEFGGLDELLAATDAELETVEGVGELRAKDIREGLRRLQEINLVDRYLQT